MGVRVIGLDALLAEMAQVGQRADRNVTRRMDGMAEKIKRRSQEYAPLKTGNLEMAHVVDKDYGGINRRKRLFIGVDASEAPYAEIMHESEYELGPGSVAKAQSSGKQVGRKFLERALDDFREETIDAIVEAVKESI